MRRSSPPASANPPPRPGGTPPRAQREAGPPAGVTRPGPYSHLRVARPSRDLAAAERFYVAGLGLEVLWRAEPDGDGEHALLMLGWPGAGWHLELVADPAVAPAPTEEDLLVLYLGGPVGEGLVRRLVDAGGERVPARNPYWEHSGVTIADPDGYRLVLSSRDWG